MLSLEICSRRVNSGLRLPGGIWWIQRGVFMLLLVWFEGLYLAKASAVEAWSIGAPQDPGLARPVWSGERLFLGRSGAAGVRKKCNQSARRV